jgi:hypothetical protein
MWPPLTDNHVLSQAILPAKCDIWPVSYRQHSRLIHAFRFFYTLELRRLTKAAMCTSRAGQICQHLAPFTGFSDRWTRQLSHNVLKYIVKAELARSWLSPA